MLIHAQQILDASDRLSRFAPRLAEGLETTLTLVLSETYQSNHFESILTEFDHRYPELELECMIAEYSDVVALVQEARTQLGSWSARSWYPPEVGFEPMSERSETCDVGNVT